MCCVTDALYLRSFPTRRSSDLGELFHLGVAGIRAVVLLADARQRALNRLDAGCFELVVQLVQAGFERLLRNPPGVVAADLEDRKSTRLNSSHGYISYAVFCLKK